MRVGSVQLLQSRSDVAESCASIAFEIESGRQTGSVVADGDVEALFRKRRGDVEPRTSSLASEPVTKRVLDEGLQQKTRHHDRKCLWRDGESHVESVAEPCRLQVQILADEVDLC